MFLYVYVFIFFIYIVIIYYLNIVYYYQYIMSITELKDNIFIVNKLFEADKCNEIVTFIKENKLLHKYTKVNKETHNNVECTYINIVDNKTNNYILLLDDFIKNKIVDVIKLVISKNIFFKSIVCDNGYTLRQIHGGTLLHTDGILDKSRGNAHSRPRLLSIIVNLNDDYDGGEFNFPIQNVKVKLKVGEIICFPPYWTHPHEVSSVLSGQYRYTINTWILE